MWRRGTKGYTSVIKLLQTKRRIWCIIYDVYWIITAWKPKRKLITTLIFFSFDRKCSTKCTARNQTRFQFLRLLVPGPYFCLPLVRKSLVDLFLIPGIITFPLFVDPFPVFCSTTILQYLQIFYNTCAFSATLSNTLQIFCNTLQHCRFSAIPADILQNFATLCRFSAIPVHFLQHFSTLYRFSATLCNSVDVLLYLQIFCNTCTFSATFCNTMHIFCTFSVIPADSLQCAAHFL